MVYMGTTFAQHKPGLRLTVSTLDLPTGGRWEPACGEPTQLWVKRILGGTDLPVMGRDEDVGADQWVVVAGAEKAYTGELEDADVGRIADVISSFNTFDRPDVALEGLPPEVVCTLVRKLWSKHQNIRWAPLYDVVSLLWAANLDRFWTVVPAQFVNVGALEKSQVLHRCAMAVSGLDDDGLSEAVLHNQLLGDAALDGLA